MLRKIIKIDQEACTGCGLCVSACHEGAIELREGKACLVSDHYCDGLGDCLPACPVGAITFEEREAAPYSEQAVQARKAAGAEPLACGCPGSQSRSFSPAAPCTGGAAPTCLAQWPVQLKLAPVNAPWLQGANLLIAADCAAYARGSFHADFMAGRVTLIGCPKLDGVDYTEKLAALLRENQVCSVTVARMEVPCCGGLERAVREAVLRSGRSIPLQVATLGTDGRIL